jgi:UDP-glucuronate decarboxylase
VIEITGSSSTLSFTPLPEDDPLRRRPDVTRAKQVLGWELKVLLEKGLVRTIVWIRSCG